MDQGVYEGRDFLRALNLKGRRFGRLTAINSQGTKNGFICWSCLCDCGKETIVTSRDLVSGHTQSCGCLFLENLSKRKRTHGGKGTRLYSIWKNMKYRCESEKARNYKYYGARGISVCNEWKHNFPAFQKWALENGYSNSLSIDRIDVNRGYSPDNCRWATPHEQRINQNPRERRTT